MQIRPKEVVSMLESKFSVLHVNGFIVKASEPGELPLEVIFMTPVSLTNDNTQLKQRKKSTWKREKKKFYFINDQIFSCSPTHFWILKTQEFAPVIKNTQRLWKDSSTQKSDWSTEEALIQNLSDYFWGAFSLLEPL